MNERDVLGYFLNQFSKILNFVDIFAKLASSEYIIKLANSNS